MKIRSGFISNSSSSSFIVATTGEAKVKIEIDLKKYGTVCRTEEEVVAFFNDEWGDVEEEPALKEQLDVCIKEINQGKEIIYGRVSNESDDWESNCLYEKGVPKQEGIEVIQGVEI